MNPSPEIVEAIIAGVIIGIGMLIYRVAQNYLNNHQDHVSSLSEASSNNGFRVALESVKEAHQLSVVLLHEHINHMESHLEELEVANFQQAGVIDRLQGLLLAQGIFVDEQGRVIAQNKVDKNLINQ